MFGSWAAPVVSAFTAFACLTSLGSWMMLVGQAGARAAHDGNFPKVYGEIDSKGVPKKGLLLASVKMTILMVIITMVSSGGGGHAADLFGILTSIAVLLTMLPYFYSALCLIKMEGATTRSVLALIACVFASLFCLYALATANQHDLAGTIVVSLIIMMFYSYKVGRKQGNSAQS